MMESQIKTAVAIIFGAGFIAGCIVTCAGVALIHWMR